MPRPTSPRAAARRVSDAAATRYRDAVQEQSRWLPVYLRAIDAADGARRAGRRLRQRNAEPGATQTWCEPDPAVPAVQTAGLSAAGELSLVLTGPEPWRRSVDAIALVCEGRRVILDGGLLEHVAERVQLCVPLPLDSLAPGRWHVQLHAGDWCHVPTSGWSRGSDDTNRGVGLEAVDGGLVLVCAAVRPATVEHRVHTGIARITVEWTPPPGTPPELVLLRPDGAVVARMAGAAARGQLLGASIEAAALAMLSADDRELTVAIPGPDGPVPLVLGLDQYPVLVRAPLHGTARLGATHVRARYDRANRLQLQLTT